MKCPICNNEMLIHLTPNNEINYECNILQQSHHCYFINNKEWYWNFCDETNHYVMTYFYYFNEQQLRIGDNKAFKRYQYFTFPKDLIFEKSYIYFKKFINLKSFL